MNSSLAIHYLCAILDFPYDPNNVLCIEHESELKRKPKTLIPHEYPFGKHTNPIRFRGTKVELFAPSVTVDYSFPAVVNKTDDEGSIVILSWMDCNGRKFGPYRMHEEDEITKIVFLNDAERIHAVQEFFAPPAQAGERKRRPQSDIVNADPLQRLARHLKHESIGFMLNEDRLSFLYYFYYIEYTDRYELSSERSGLIATYPNTKLGIEALIKRIEKIERNFNAEKLLARD